MRQSAVVQGLEWVHSLLQELENEGVALPMGDYNVALAFVENAREALWDYTTENSPFIYLCPKCGSDEVFSDAYVGLNEVDDVRTFDAAYCMACEQPLKHVDQRPNPNYNETTT